MLYLSPQAIFAPGKAIRGGIPVVFRQSHQWTGRQADTHAEGGGSMTLSIAPPILCVQLNLVPVPCRSMDSHATRR
jgi:hypothetical protein